MAGNLTTWAENKILEHSLGKTSWTMPTNVYAALFTVAPTDAGGGTEVSGGSYARIATAWDTAVSGAITTNAALRFPSVGNASGNWGSVVALGLFDASTSGNLIWYGPLSAAVSVASGDFFNIAAGDLDISLD